MRPRNQTQREAQAELNRRRLLAAESVALLLLLRRRNRAVSNGLRAGNPPESIAYDIERSWRTGIPEARSLARSHGATRLRNELYSLGVPVALATYAAEEAVRDSLRASRIARNYSQLWLAKAKETTANEASGLTVSRVKTIAATESAEAYNAGRLVALRAYPNIRIQRVWDSVLDRRTCPICESADGDIVSPGESFPNGEPPVHPLCRCTWQLIALEER